MKHVSADFTDYDAFDHVVRLKVGGMSWRRSGTADAQIYRLAKR